MRNEGIVRRDSPSYVAAVTDLAPSIPVRPDAGGRPGDGLAPTPCTLTVDGTEYTIVVDPSMAGLKALREYTMHERPKRGCQEGICGKCESDVNGTPTRLCITPIGELDGAVIATPAPRKSMWSV